MINDVVIEGIVVRDPWKFMDDLFIQLVINRDSHLLPGNWIWNVMQAITSMSGSMAEPRLILLCIIRLYSLRFLCQRFFY